jgi:hypothetical protein
MICACQGVLALGGLPDLPDAFGDRNPRSHDHAFDADPEVADHELTEGMNVMIDC